MLAAIVLVAAVLSSEAPADPRGAPAEAPGGPEPTGGAANVTVVPSSAFSVEVGFWKAPHPAPGDLDSELTGGMEGVPWRLGPVRAGLRVGLLAATPHAVCTEDEGECVFFGAYVGGMVRLAPLHDENVSPWVEVAVTPFFAKGFLLEDSNLVGIDLPRVAGGVDVIVPAWNLRLGAFVFRSETYFSATPPPLADGHDLMWGGGIRFTSSVREGR